MDLWKAAIAVSRRTWPYRLRFNTWGTRETCIIGRLTSLRKKRLQGGIRIRVLDNAYYCEYCEGALPTAAGVTGGLVECPRACQDLFRWFKPHRVHARSGLFLHQQKKVSGKRESVS